jgi:hypothetical protein
MRCAIAGIACERFRIKHDRWPAALAELCPEFLPEVPIDPYVGKPLKLEKQDDGVVVYSVGTLPQTATAAAYHQGLPAGIDIGFRLWNPDSRRLPPPG